MADAADHIPSAEDAEHAEEVANLTDRAERAEAKLARVRELVSELAACTLEPSQAAGIADVLAGLPLLLRSARKTRGLHQDDVAEQAGVAPSTVCRIERGGGCNIESAIALFRWLGVRTPKGDDR